MLSRVLASTRGPLLVQRCAASAASSKPAKKEVLRVEVCKPADYPEILHWTLNNFIYTEPFEQMLNSTPEGAYDFWAAECKSACESGLSIKLLDEHGLFAGYRLTRLATRGEKYVKAKTNCPRFKIVIDIFAEFNEQVWKLNPDAQKMLHQMAGLIVPTYRGRTDFQKVLLTHGIDYDKMKKEGVHGEFGEVISFNCARMSQKTGYKAIFKTDLSKYPLPDGSIVKTTDGLQAPILFYRTL